MQLFGENYGVAIIEIQVKTCNYIMIGGGPRQTKIVQTGLLPLAYDNTLIKQCSGNQRE